MYQNLSTGLYITGTWYDLSHFIRKLNLEVLVQIKEAVDMYASFIFHFLQNLTVGSFYANRTIPFTGT